MTYQQINKKFDPSNETTVNFTVPKISISFFFENASHMFMCRVEDSPYYTILFLKTVD